MSTPPPLGMSAPPPPPPPPPSSSRKGCFIALGVALVLLLLLCMGGCIYLARNPGGFTAWGISAAKPAMLQSMASDIPAETRTAFETEYEAYANWLRSATREDFAAKGQAVVAPFQYLQGALQDKSLTADEVNRFVEMAREVRGVPAPAAAPTAPAEATEAAPEGATAGAPTDATEGAAAPADASAAAPAATSPEGGNPGGSQP